MFFKVGDYVTRNSHNHDVVFRIEKISNNIAYLKGLNIRLYADSSVADLSLVEDNEVRIDDEQILTDINNEINLDRDNYFYLPGKILHIDGDKDYLERCMNLYKKMRLQAFGFVVEEDEMADKITEYLREIKPNILVITGHDVIFNKDNTTDLSNYKNSINFIETIRKARLYERDQEKLVIIAGACQSNYEELIKSGANFASSPKRVNIHALDPGIVASMIALSDKNKSIDLLKIINSTKYKEKGIGGIITNGTMYVGYPRWILILWKILLIISRGKN